MAIPLQLRSFGRKGQSVMAELLPTVPQIE